MIKRMHTNKKGILFSASVVVFLITMLIFTVAVYRHTEKGELKLISNSYALKVINIEDSIQQAIRTMYKVNNQMSFNMDTVSISGVYYDKTQFNATLNMTGKGNANTSYDLARLKSVLENKMDGVTVDLSSLPPVLTLNASSGITGYKEDSGASGEKLVIYYNKSGESVINVSAISILVTSFENVGDVGWTAAQPGGGGLEFQVKISEVDSIINASYNKTLSKDISLVPQGTSYDLYVNNSVGSTQFLNITLDYEKVTIANLQGSHNISVLVYTHSQNKTKRFVVAEDVINITIPEFNLNKIGNIEFY